MEKNRAIVHGGPAGSPAGGAPSPMSRRPDPDATRVLPDTGAEAPTIRRLADPDATRLHPAADPDATIRRAAIPLAVRQDPDATIPLYEDPDATRVAPPARQPSTRAGAPMGSPHPSQSTGGTGTGSGSGARRSLAQSIALPSGYRLHEYRIDAVLGQGSFGITYLATDVNLDTQVAIKEYLPAELAIRTADSTVRPRSIDVASTLLDGLDQFLVEARTLATFRHPNIVRVARFFEANRTAYMVMDYERGSPLLNCSAHQFSSGLPRS